LTSHPPKGAASTLPEPGVRSDRALLLRVL
jgi:hypothetical protein